MKLTLRMIGTLVIITMCSAAVLSGINRWAEPLIEQHVVEARREAITTLHPKTENFNQKAEYGPENYPIYSVRDKEGDTIGYTFIAAGTGYQGEIKMMAGLNQDLEKMAGLVILEQVETPGLGARIEEKAKNPGNKKEYKFRNWFEGLNPEPKIEYVRNRQPEENNQIKAITGATISSESVVKIINEAYPRVKEIISESKNTEMNKNNE